jgi:hypothetical protein
MNRKRLAKLADFLENDPDVNKPGKFYLGTWMQSLHSQPRIWFHPTDVRRDFFKGHAELFKEASKNTDGDYVEGFKDDGNVHKCKTFGCALGWAATIPAFRKAGLKNPRSPSYETSSGTKYIGYDAAVFFFDIEYYEAAYLFDPNTYTKLDNPKEVVKRIRKLLKDDEKREAANKQRTTR